MKSKTIDGMLQINQSTFIPTPQLFRSDADLTVVFLSGNGVRFLEAMDDDWYRATVDHGNITFSLTQGQLTNHIPVEAASPMGCLEKWQWCNSAFPRDTGCGPLAGKLDSLFGAAPLFNLTENEIKFGGIDSTTPAGSRYVWLSMMEALDLDTIRVVLNELGPTALASQSLLNGAIQYPLPQNQWQFDVTNWFNIVLASVQAQYVLSALGDPGMERLEAPPFDAEEQKLCDNQVRNST